MARPSGPMRCGLVVAAALAWGAAGAPPVEAERAARAGLEVHPDAPRAGEPALLRFSVRDTIGRRIRFLQFVHERPMHLIVVSRGLDDFDHIHPELAFDDAYEVTHTFGHGGTYRLFADYTPPGSGTIVDAFDVPVRGEAPRVRPLIPDDARPHTSAGVRVTLAFDRAPRAGEDLRLGVTLADSASGAPVTDLQLYLGALAHFIIVSEDLKDFIHAHPVEAGEVVDPSQDPTTVHVHDPLQLAKWLAGPSPSTIHAVTSLPRAGRYRLWMQFQRAGAVVTVPFVFAVAGPAPVARARVVAPANSIRIRVGASGYEPARIEVERGQEVTLAFSRPDAGNCGGVVMIPALGIRRDLPVGGTVLVRFSPSEPAEIPFHCGMNMLQGVIVVR